MVLQGVGRTRHPKLQPQCKGNDYKRLGLSLSVGLGLGLGL